MAGPAPWYGAVPFAPEGPGLHLALLFLSSAFSADLELAVGFGDAEPSRVVVKDVLEVAPPRLLVADDQGERRMVGLDVERDADGNYHLAARIWAVREDAGGGLALTEVGAPRIIVRPGAEARVTHDFHALEGDGRTGLLHEGRLHLAVTVIE